MKGTATFTRLLDRAAHLVPICVWLGFVLYGGGKQRGVPGVAEPGPVRHSAASATASAVSNWNRRGAWDDSFRLDFDADWVFPWGSNHLSGVEVLSRGEVWPRWDDTNRIAGLDVPLAIVPGLTQFSCARTADNSYVLAWTNAAPNRSTNVLASAAIELRRCGDRVVTQDGVASAAARELSFPRFGWGQDEEWVEHFFTNDFAAIESVGYTNWVDGIALEPGNGFYKLTVTLSNAPPETVNLTVGEYSVAVTNAGDYVFLLEKGVRYPIGFSFLPDGVAYSFDDGGPADPPEPDWPDPPGQNRGVPPEVYYYTYHITGDFGRGQELVVPTQGGDGYACYWPSLSIYSYSAIDGILLPNTMFAAIVHDIPAGEFPVVTWKSYGSVIERGTFFLVSDSHLSWEELDVVAEYCGVELRGKITLERHVRETGVELYGGGVIFVEGAHLNCSGEPEPASSQAEASLEFWWALTAPGTLRLESSCGGSVSVRASESAEPVSLPLVWHADADSSGHSNLTVSVSGVLTNGQFTFTLEFDDDWIDPMAATATLAVVELEVEAEATWPTNRHRHVFGPKERFAITTNPSVGLSCSPLEGIEIDGNTVTAPGRPCAFAVWLTVDGAVCNRVFNCIEPTGIQGKNPRPFLTPEWDPDYFPKFVDGEAGVDMHIDTWLEPTYVSFSHLRWYEGYAPPINRQGWYTDTSLFPDSAIEHGSAAGASDAVHSRSITAFGNETESGDCAAAVIGCCQAYTNGSYQLAIPLYWFVEGGGYTNTVPGNIQTAWVYSNGTMRINKNGVTMERTTNDVHSVIYESE